MNKTAKVWIAGAGPGDARLLTVRARQLLDEADVIVYDALISTEILSLIPPGKELVHVGKRSGHHLMPQEEINTILLKEAQKGKRVLRLKGGDPFVFGRGGEELELLASRGVPFEVIPGITSAAAVPAYAGIPVTHRDYTSSFHVITGHPRKGGVSRIDYQALVKAGGTLIFLMGITSMESILKGLMEAGIDKDTPAAVLEKGTLAKQRQVVSTVSCLFGEAAKAQIGTPAVIVVGDVCLLAEQFHWAGDRPLGGREFLLTRPRQSMSGLAAKLRELGAQVIELPAVRTVTIDPNPVLGQALRELAGWSGERWLVFTSPTGVCTFFSQMMKMGMDIRDLCAGLNPVKFAAIGTGTEKALHGFGVFADLVPDVYCARSLGEELAHTVAPGGYVMAVRAREGSDELFPPLWAAGIHAADIPLYETLYETYGTLKEKISSMLWSGEIDGVTFTSVSTVKGFVRAVPLPHYRGIRAICIGEQTAAEARKYGMQIQTSREASIDSMAELILEMFGDKPCKNSR